MPFVAWVTVGLIALVTVGLIIWDIIVATNKIPNGIDTISGRMKAWGKQALILPWAWAMLYGHFWGPLKINQLIPHKIGIFGLVVVAWGVLLASIYCRQHGVTISSSWLTFLFVLNFGALCGALLWAQ